MSTFTRYTKSIGYSDRMELALCVVSFHYAIPAQTVMSLYGIVVLND